MTNPTTDSAMYRTMHRQPADLSMILDDRWQPAADAAALLEPAGRIFVTGIGTSYHAAMFGAWWLRAAGSDARAVSSWDLAHYPENLPIRSTDAVIVMAHTGVKTCSGVALQRAVAAGATVLSVGSNSAEHPGSQLVLRTVERETSAAYTTSHLCAMAVLAQVAVELAERRNLPMAALAREELLALPKQISDLLDREAEIAPIATAAVAVRVFATAAGPNECTALELVIKAREAAYADVDGLALEQYIHGPMINFNVGDMAVIVHVPGQSFDRSAQMAALLAELQGLVWLVGQPIATLPDVAVFELPVTSELISPLLAVVPMQMLAYQMAVMKGTHPDTFRRDDPVYKEAHQNAPL